MKKRLIAALAGTLFVTTSLLPAISAKAEPTSVEQARTQYEELKKKVEETYPSCDVELQFGGQPIYYYIVSAE